MWTLSQEPWAQGQPGVPAVEGALPVGRAPPHAHCRETPAQEGRKGCFQLRRKALQASQPSPHWLPAPSGPLFPGARRGLGRRGCCQAPAKLFSHSRPHSGLASFKDISNHTGDGSEAEAAAGACAEQGTGWQAAQQAGCGGPCSRRARLWDASCRAECHLQDSSSF